MPIVGRVLAVTGQGAAIAAFVMTSDHFGRTEWPDRHELGQPALTEAHRGDPHRADFTMCIGPVRANCVVDGDTFWFENIKFRLADIDAPEIFEPECAGEARTGEMAKASLPGLLNAGAFTLIAGERDEDRFGRKLRVVARNDVSLGEVLVREGWDDAGATRHWIGLRENSPGRGVGLGGGEGTVARSKGGFKGGAVSFPWAGCLRGRGCPLPHHG